MIRQLQRKFIAITMASLLLVMAVVLGAINIANVYHMNERADSILAMLAINDGAFPNQKKETPAPGDGDVRRFRQTSEGGVKTAEDQVEGSGGLEPERRPKPGGGGSGLLTAETPFETRYFTVRTDLQQNIEKVDTGHIAAIAESEARQYAEDVLKSGAERGYGGKYRYLVAEQPEGLLLIFVDCRNQIDTAMNFFRNSCAIALASLLIVLLLVSVLSKRVMRPVIESMEKQKQFITDAGHEIKTPLAIISANNDVIEMTGGQSEWTVSIRNQVERLSGLVKNLLTLAKMDEGQVERTFTHLVLSDLVTETVWSFEPLANKKDLRISIQVQPGIVVSGDEAGLAHLVAILTDNAVKYANSGGEISVVLTKRARTSCLEISNTCANPPSGDLSKLFNRFYRGDESRSRESGGYGIGLSVAQAIVKAHGGRISAGEKEGGRISFTVELNR